jgi:tRNA(Ile)-lysidine synthase
MANRADELKSILGRVLRYVRDNALICEGERVLAAFSGGCDSTAMLIILKRISGILKFTLAAAHVNHGIRGDEARRDAEFCQRLCEAQNIPFYLCEGDAPALSDAQRIGIEEAARRLRYGLLEEIADKHSFDKITTAHTADDNLETVILNLIRGGGTAGAAGIPPRRGRIVRPVLALTRADTEHVTALAGVDYVTDSTNLDDFCARNAIRHRVIPALKELNPSVASSVLSASAMLREDAQALNSIAESYLSEHTELFCSGLASLEPAIASRVLKIAAQRKGASPDRALAGDMLSLCRGGLPSGRIDVGGGVVFAREYDRIYFTRLRERKDPEPLALIPGTDVFHPVFGHVRVEKIEKGQKVFNFLNTFRANCATIGDNLVLRARRSGDIFAKNAKSGAKPLARLMMDLKIPREKRGEMPVIASERGVHYVFGIGYNAMFEGYDPNLEGILVHIDRP